MASTADNRRNHDAHSVEQAVLKLSVKKSCIRSMRNHFVDTSFVAHEVVTPDVIRYAARPEFRRHSMVIHN